MVMANPNKAQAANKNGNTNAARLKWRVNITRHFHKPLLQK